MIDERLAEILVCTACHGQLEQQEPLLVCAPCGLGFEVKDEIPNMLLGDARKL